MAEQVRTPRHRAAVIGSPVAHSLSPVLHRAAYRSLGLEDWDYERIELGAQDLPAMLARVRGSAGPGQGTWAGLSVTMPHKQTLLGLLDVVEPLAATVGSVNTVVAQRSGPGEALLAGFNTDVAGIVGALRDTAAHLLGPPPAAPGSAGPAASEAAGAPPRRAVVLGSGATACSALAALTELGATTITVAARRHAGPGRAMAAAHRMGLEPRALTWQPGLPASDAEVAQELALADLVVSTLPAGAADTLVRPTTTLLTGPQETGRERVGVLLDVVYRPWPTVLARAWSRAGGRVAPGWLMLLHQAVPQVRLMTGRAAPIAPMRSALETALTRR